MPKISVIVPVYKVEKYLARCVDSILAQTFKDYELILVDDGSPDNCPKMCDEYAEKYDFIKVIHKENGGLSDALNAGIKYVNTTNSEWITFIDSDDYVHEKYLEKLFSMTGLGVRITCLSGGIDNPYIGEKNYPILIDTPENLWVKNEFSLISKVSKLYKKELFKNILFPKGKLFEDEYISYKVIYSCKEIAVMKVKLYFYEYRQDSIMRDIWSVEKMENNFNSLLDALNYYDVYNYERSFFKQFERVYYRFIENVKNVNDKNSKRKFNNNFRRVLKRYKAKLPIIKYEDYYLSSYSKFYCKIIKLKFYIKEFFVKIFS